MDQWRYWTILGGHFASSAREDWNLAVGAKHSCPTLELRTSTIFTDEYTSCDMMPDQNKRTIIGNGSSTKSRLALRKTLVA